ncbi:VOC family protein [Amycolatopsis pithecellobii]|uniref:Glyoxalase n=1 Tax=Amycolatopsis pithecellobii TaxID=664692 RepID=A0A6N7Z071_9PSEU|nr:VOC family protein [Amycolatopsis pithecellobii]MTD57668.1 glyoxalase [Amycolatopsis pithecellobii]
MSEQPTTILFPVRDLAKTKALFKALLGVDPTSDEPYYVSFETGGRHIGLVPNGHSQGMTGPVVYWSVDDIKGTVQTLLDAGAQVQQDVRNVGGGRMVATVTDADGNPIGLMQDS